MYSKSPLPDELVKRVNHNLQVDNADSEDDDDDYSSDEDELQNNRILTYEGYFGFHPVASAKESRLYERAQHPSRVTCSQLRNAVSTSKWVGAAWADSLLSLAFATRRNPKHPSYVSIRLFCNSTSQLCCGEQTI